MASLASDDSAGLEARVAALERRNAELLAKLSALEGGDAGGEAAAAAAAAAGADETYSMPDQPARFAYQKETGCKQTLAIDEIFEPAQLAGKRVLVTGGNRGLGLALVKALLDCKAVVLATCRRDQGELADLEGVTAIPGVDVTKDEDMANLTAGLPGDAPLDVVINNAGYFMRERESIVGGTMDFGEEMKQIDICSVGMLRVTNALYHAGKLVEGTKVAMITSQGGSIDWRDTQCPDGGDYGHHMSKASANMAGKLVANELKSKKIPVSILHPGFNRTDMTSKYSHIWDIEGAVDASVGAKRTLHEINKMTMATTGQFINCEDGRQIPW